MAAPTALTLLDLAKRTHNNKISDVAEVLDKKIPLFRRLPFMQATDMNSHLITRRGSLPSGTWRQLNSGVAPNKSDVIQIKENIGLLEGWSEIDVVEAKMSGNIKAYRKMEDIAHVEGMSQQLETALFYQNLATNIASFNGLAHRYDEITTDLVYDADASGSDGSVTSIWIVEMGPRGLYGIYPHGSGSYGLDVDPKPAMTKEDSSGGLYDVFRTKFSFSLGLAIKDVRAVKRIANIPLTSAGLTAAIPLMRKAINRLPGIGQKAILVSPSILDLFEEDADDKTNVHYGPESPYGDTILKFKGVPMYKSEMILETEDTIS